MNLIVKTYAWAKGLKSSLYQKYIGRQLKSLGKDSIILKLSNLSNPQCISIGSRVYIGQQSVLEAITMHRGKTFSPEICIGDGSRFGDFCHLGSTNFIHIGENVLAGRFVLIMDHSHGSTEHLESQGTPFTRPLMSKGGITIGDRVWIGDKVTILSGVTIGEGAVIGANSVVNRDVPPYCVAAGIPAKIVKGA